MVVSDADWATGDVIIIDENGDRQPDFWLLSLGAEGVYAPAVKISFDVNSKNLISVSNRN
jgi:hypothetical protein